MQFTMSVSAFLAMAASVLAQTADFNPVYTPLENEVIPAGSTYEVTWDAPAPYADGTITITLIGGPNQGSQVPIQQVAAGIPNSQEKFSWTIDASLGAAAVYGLKFSLDSNPDIFQYSMPFSIDASGEPEGTSTSVSAGATVTSAYGIKTVTLSEAPEPTTTAEPTTTVITTSAAPTTTSTISTTIRANTTTLVTSTSASSSSSSSSSSVTLPSSSSSLPPSVTEDVTAPAETTPGSGAASLSTSFVAVAGLVMAYMAL